MTATEVNAHALWTAQAATRRLLMQGRGVEAAVFARTIRQVAELTPPSALRTVALSTYQSIVRELCHGA